MASEILSQRRYNLIYKRAMDYLNNRLGASASSISESYKNAFAAAYSEAYNKANFGNNNIRYEGASNADLINWTISRSYLVKEYNNNYSNLGEDGVPIPGAFNSRFIDLLFEKLFIEDSNGYYIENPTTPFEVDPNRRLTEEERNRLIEHLQRENIPYRLKKIYDDYGYTGGAAPIQTDPLLIDLNGDGIKTTTINNGKFFDHQSDGFRELSAWVSVCRLGFNPTKNREYKTKLKTAA